MGNYNMINESRKKRFNKKGKKNNKSKKQLGGRKLINKDAVDELMLWNKSNKNMQTESGSKNAYDWLKSNADDIEYTFNYLKHHNIEDDQEALNSEISKTYDEKMFDVHPDPNI